MTLNNKKVKIRKAQGCFHISDGHGFAKLQGVVYTPIGIVEAVSMNVVHHKPISRFRFIFRGELHEKTVRKYYSQIGLATVAHRFAKEIAAQYAHNYE